MNKEPTNNEDSHDVKSKVYNKDGNIFNKKKSSKKCLTKDENNDNVETVEVSKQIKSDINEH